MHVYWVGRWWYHSPNHLSGLNDSNESSDRHFLQFWGLDTHLLHLTFFLTSYAIVLLKISFNENADWARDFPFHQWLWMDIIYIWCESATFYLLTLPQISTNGVKNLKSIVLSDGKDKQHLAELSWSNKIYGYKNQYFHDWNCVNWFSFLQLESSYFSVFFFS